MNNKEIWVICGEIEFDDIYILQLISKAFDLGRKTNREVGVVCIGKYNEEAFKHLADYGADRIYFKESTLLDGVIFSGYIGKAIERFSPSFLIIPSTKFSKAIAAALSNRYNFGLTADCIQIEDVEGHGFVCERTALNNSVVARIKYINCETGICTVKRDVFHAFRKDENKINAAFIDLKYSSDVTSSFPLITIIKKKQIENRVKDIGSARILFAVGRGIKEKSTLSLLKKVAKEYKAEIIGSRAAVEAGMVEKSRQVGQSGICVAPDIYCGFGISGASQHIAGIMNAKVIVAVNIDENAPIFDYADYAIVDDVNKVLKSLELLALASYS